VAKRETQTEEEVAVVESEEPQRRNIQGRLVRSLTHGPRMALLFGVNMNQQQIDAGKRQLIRIYSEIRKLGKTEADFRRMMELRKEALLIADRIGIELTPGNR